MAKHFTKALSVGLSLALCATMIAPAFAANFTDLQKAIDSTEDGFFGDNNDIEARTNDGVRDVTLNGTVTREEGEAGITVSDGKNVTIDLNGQKVVDGQKKIGDDDKSSIKAVGDGSTLTVKDTSADQSGVIESNKQSTLRGDGGTVNVEGGTIGGDALGGIFGLNGAVVNVTGGTVTGTERGLQLQSGSKGTISGEGTVVTGGSKYGVYASGGETEIKVEGGTVTGEKYGIYGYDGADVTVSGGTVAGTSDTGIFVNKPGSEVEVSGGTVTGGKRGIELQSGVKGTISGEDTTVTGGEIGAIAFHEGTEIKVEGGTVTGIYGIYASDGADVTFSGGTVIGEDTGIYLYNGAHGTVSGGEIIGTDTDEGDGICAYGEGTELTFSGGAVIAEDRGLDISRGATATVSGGTIDGKWFGIIMPHDEDTYTTAPATCVVTGGEISGDYEGLYVGILHVFEMTGGTISGPRLGLRNSPTISIKGGSIILNNVYVRVPGIFDSSKISVTGGTIGESLRPYVEEGYIVIDNGDGSYTIIAPAAFVDTEIEVEIDEPAIPLASGPVTRAQFIDYLWRHEGEPASDGVCTFEDVAEDHEFVLALAWAEQNGIAVANEDGTFEPDELVTVAAVREFLGNFAPVFGTNAVAAADLKSLSGADDEAVINCDEVMAEFFGEEYASVVDEKIEIEA